MFIICFREDFFYDKNWTRDGVVTPSALTHSHINDSEKEKIVKIKETQEHREYRMDISIVESSKILGKEVFAT